MNKFTSLAIALTAVLISCKVKTDSENSNRASFDINAELRKARQDSMTYYSAAQIDSISNVIIRSNTISAMLGNGKEDVVSLLLARTKPGDAEIHEQMDDIAFIRSGHEPWFRLPVIGMLR